MEQYLSLVSGHQRLTFDLLFDPLDPEADVRFACSDGLTYRLSFARELFTIRACVEVWLLSERIPPVQHLLCRILIVGMPNTWYPVICDAGNLETHGFARQALFRLLVNSPSLRDDAELSLLMLYSGADFVR